MARALKTASEMRQIIKMNEYAQDSSLARSIMSKIETATKNNSTTISGWFSREDSRKIDLTFTPLGYVITYKSYDKLKDRYWISLAW